MEAGLLRAFPICVPAHAAVVVGKYIKSKQLSDRTLLYSTAVFPLRGGLYNVVQRTGWDEQVRMMACLEYINAREARRLGSGRGRNVRSVCRRRHRRRRRRYCLGSRPIPVPSRYSYPRPALFLTN